MNILVISWFYEPFIGGVESQLQDNIEYLSKRGHRVTLITSAPQNRKSSVNYKNLKVFYTPLLNPCKNDENCSSLFNNFLVEHIRRNKYNLIYTQNISYPFAPLRSKSIFHTAEILKIPILEYSAHAHQKNAHISSSLQTSFGVNLCVVSEWAKLKTHQVTGIPLNKIRVAYPGVNTDIFRPLSRSIYSDKLKKKIGFDKKIIFYPGRILNPDGTLIKSKRFLLLCRAFAKVNKIYKGKIVLLAIMNKSTYSKASIIMGSDLFLRNSLRKSGIQNSVFFINKPVPHSIMPSLYNMSDVVCCSSVNETFGLVYSEAMAAGKVAIGTRSGALSEIIEDKKTGFLVNPDDSEELAEIISKVLGDDKLRMKIGKSARRRIVGKFSVKQTAKAAEKIMLSVSRPKL